MKKKMKENKGITIIHAVVSIMIFAVFASIIMSATSNNIKSAKAQKAYQQAYLSVSNAAQMVIDGIADDRVVITKHVTVNNGTETYTLGADGWSYDDRGELNNPFLGFTNGSTDFLKAFENAYIGTNAIENTYYITTQVGSGGSLFTSKVVCHMFFLPQGSVCANFSLYEESGNKNNDNYYMNIEIPVEYVDYVNDDPDDVKNETVISATKSTRDDIYYVEFNKEDITINKGTYIYEKAQ